jgi:putative endonuclease
VFLRRQGLAIVERNHRCRSGEIDIVALHGGVLVFVEVRYRASSRFGSPAATVNAAKQRRLFAASRHFLATHPEHAHRRCRFDVVSVTKPHYRLRLEWIRNALYADDSLT